MNAKRRPDHLTATVADLEELLAAALETADSAAAFLREQARRDDLTIHTKDTPTDMVTDVDSACERLIVERLAALRPHDGIHAEEGTNIVGTSGVDWIIDPIDGTTDFIYDHPGYSVSIGAAVDGVDSIGVVADPFHHDVFSARLGGGAHRNGKPIMASAVDDLSLALVATGFSYSAAERRRQALVVAEVIPHIRDIRRMGGAALDLCFAAMGRIDAYYERGLQRWDLIAGTVIAAEAGCQVGDLDGGPPSTDYCIAAPPSLFGPLTELIAAAEEATTSDAAKN